MRPAQKVALGVALAAGSATLIARPAGVAWLFRRIRCALRGHHNPVKHPLGGFRCTECGAAGETLDDMGFEGGSYVGPLRRTFDRGPYGGLTRSEGYEAEAQREERTRVEPFIRGDKFGGRRA
jgi:hypothetical protein